MDAPTFSKMSAPVLEQILTDLLEPDSAGIRQATERLREALEEPEGPEGLVELLRGAERPQIRHLAAVLLRRRLRKLPQELIDRLPHVLVEALERETDSCSRGALGQLGARLLLLGGLKFWEPVEKWIQEAAREPQKMENLLRSALPEALRALQELLSRDPELGADALEVLDEFLEANPESVIPHLRPVLELCLQVAGDECKGDTVRVRALATLTFLAQKIPRALLRGDLLALLLRGLLVPLCAPLRPQSPDPEESWGGGGAALPPATAPPRFWTLWPRGCPPKSCSRNCCRSWRGRAEAAAPAAARGRCWHWRRSRAAAAPPCGSGTWAWSWGPCGPAWETPRARSGGRRRRRCESCGRNW
ncbi:importin-4-like, partial [Haemorhous mexicanus]|uniref:importin-4-like n=1 Tax=Haemorhous mexicanus TaxID=30427 RepID=UPI0028BE2E96